MIAIHPGEILREEFLAPLGISAYRLAKELHIPAPRVHDIVLEKRGISADTALRLGRYFNLPAKFWMGLQSEYELRLAMNAANIEGIVPRDAAQLKEAS
jgi:addiction module HigA family antidote